MPSEQQIYGHLATRLYLAFIAHRLGIKLATAERTYEQQGKKAANSAPWLGIAKSVEGIVMEVTDAGLAEMRAKPERVQ